jgi:hypothetical protein
MCKSLKRMVARDGVEPPTPAFSDLGQPEPTTTYRFAGDCQVPANTWRPERSWAGIMAGIRVELIVRILLGRRFRHMQVRLNTPLARFPLSCAEKK